MNRYIRESERSVVKVGFMFLCPYIELFYGLLQYMFPEKGRAPHTVNNRINNKVKIPHRVLAWRTLLSLFIICKCYHIMIISLCGKDGEKFGIKQ